MLTTIQTFTEEISGIEREISGIMEGEGVEEEVEFGGREGGVIGRVEEKIYQRCFRRAMEVSYEEGAGGEEEYLPFLRI